MLVDGDDDGDGDELYYWLMMVKFKLLIDDDDLRIVMSSGARSRGVADYLFAYRSVFVVPSNVVNTDAGRHPA